MHFYQFEGHLQHDAQWNSVVPMNLQKANGLKSKGRTRGTWRRDERAPAADALTGRHDTPPALGARRAFNRELYTSSHMSCFNLSKNDLFHFSTTHLACCFHNCISSPKTVPPFGQLQAYPCSGAYKILVICIQIMLHSQVISTLYNFLVWQRFVCDIN